MMGVDSINEPGQRTNMLFPQSINEPAVDVDSLPKGPPTVDGLNPAEAAAGGPDLLMVIHGTNFSPMSEIKFGSTVLPTTFEKPTKINTTVTPAVAGVYPVIVRNEFGESAPVDFTVTEVEEARAIDPDDLDEEIAEAEEEGDFKPLHATHKRKPKRR